MQRRLKAGYQCLLYFAGDEGEVMMLKRKCSTTAQEKVLFEAGICGKLLPVHFESLTKRGKRTPFA
jgi:hypothetical protein